MCFLDADSSPIQDAACEKLVVVGQGYVGLPIALRAAERGYHVIGFEVNEDRVRLLREAHSFIEDVTDRALLEVIDGGRYLPSSDPGACSGFDVAVITVPTPLVEGAPDLSAVRDASSMLSRFLRPGALVILESTSYPGTTEEVVSPTLEEGSGLEVGVDFHVGFSPERIDPGNHAYPFWKIPKVVSGVDPVSLKAVDVFYSRLVDKTVPVSSPKAAELTKLLENTFRHVNIALVNELAMAAFDLGIDIWEVIDAASTKPFGFMPFTPGAGVGGHCLPIDPTYLSWRMMRTLGKSFRFVELANDINDHMPQYVAQRVAELLNRSSKAVNGSKVLLLGLSYKANTSDHRESPSKRVALELITAGARVHAADPHVGRCDVHEELRRVELTSDELRWADVVVLLTDHDAFDYDLVAKEAAHVLDTRNRVDGPTVEHL